jgi:hypothetical protein
MPALFLQPPYDDKMANEIGAFFEAETDKIKGVAHHLRNSWEARMRRQILPGPSRSGRRRRPEGTDRPSGTPPATAAVLNSLQLF